MLQAVRLGISLPTPGPSLLTKRLATTSLLTRPLTTSALRRNDERPSPPSSSQQSQSRTNEEKRNGDEASPTWKSSQDKLTSEGVTAVGAGFSRALLFPGLSSSASPSSSASAPASSTISPASQEARPLSETSPRSLDRAAWSAHAGPSDGPGSSSSSSSASIAAQEGSQRRPSPPPAPQDEQQQEESPRVLLTNLPITATPWDLHRIALRNRERRHEPGARLRSDRIQTPETLSGTNGVLSIKPIYTRTWRPTRTAVVTFDRPSRAKAYVQHVKGLDRTTTDSRDETIGARLARPTAPTLPSNLPPTHVLLHYLLLPSPSVRPRSSGSTLILLRGLPPHLSESRLAKVLSRHYRLDLSPSWPKPRRSAFQTMRFPPDLLADVLGSQRPRPVIRLENPFGPSQVTATFLVRLETQGDAARFVRWWHCSVWDEEKKGGAKARARREEMEALRRARGRGSSDRRENDDDDGDDDDDVGRWGRDVANPSSRRVRGELDNSKEPETWIVEAQMLYPG